MCEQAHAILLTKLFVKTQWKLFCNFGKYFFHKTIENLEKISQESVQNTACNIQEIALKYLH